MTYLLLQIYYSLALLLITYLTSSSHQSAKIVINPQSTEISRIELSDAAKATPIRMGTVTAWVGCSRFRITLSREENR